ncbi:MAG: roadblock/LC7 domain-containing protein [Thermoanaerobaculia bacterium]
MFEERLADIAARLQGLVYASLVASDGIRVEGHAVEGRTPDGLDADNLAVELLTQIKNISQNHGELGMGEVSEYSVSTERFIVLLGKVAPGYYLMLVLSEGASLGRARFELRRAPLTFESDLV